MASKRADLKVGRLSDDRVATLEAIPGWTWDTLEDAWQEGLAHLRDFVEREGHARVPTQYVADDDYGLGSWVSNRRRDHYAGRLRHSRVATLEALPGWTWDPVEDDWQRGLVELRAYVERMGSARMPQKHVTHDGFQLGSWVSHQRVARSKGQFPDDRVATVEALPGWTWDRNEADWQEGFSRLKTYVERAGDARVPQRHSTDDGYRLGVWVSHQRVDRSKGRLPDDRVTRLGALPGWTWDPLEDVWQEGLAHLRTYVEREGHARVPQSHSAEDGHRLGLWVASQRADLKVGRLSDDRVAALESLSGWAWDAFEASWQEGLAHLRAFVEREGHVRVPQKHVAEDGFRLGQWVMLRRREHDNGRLSDDRVAALESLPGWAWDPNEDFWQEGVAHVLAFVEREGHARVPQKSVPVDGYRLG
jgi:hypothetical protein